MIDGQVIDSAGFPSRKCQHLFQNGGGSIPFGTERAKILARRNRPGLPNPLR